ncbi:MAG: guanylate kinase [Acidobacteriota bacterium]
MTDGTTTDAERAAGSRGDLFILSAPSGTGKTTMIRALLEGELSGLLELHFAISHTTRKPRGGEVDGQDYHFTDPETFRERIAEERFLEWAEVHNNYYGTSLEEVVPFLDRGIDVLLDIDVQGAERVLELCSDPSKGPLRTPVHSVFILPPSRSALQERLYQRDLDDREEIERRLAVSRAEIQRSPDYEYVIVNRDARAASYVLASIILEKRHRQMRMRGEVEEILGDFDSGQDEGSMSGSGRGAAHDQTQARADKG